MGAAAMSTFSSATRAVAISSPLRGRTWPRPPRAEAEGSAMAAAPVSTLPLTSGSADSKMAAL